MIEINKIDTGYHNRACNKIQKFLDTPFNISIIADLISDSLQAA